jgi:glutathione S-transferase
MQLIGMFDSPFVRRVAVSMQMLHVPFEHLDWSVGRDFDRIGAHNPLGRVPTLLLPDGTALVDSAAILDFLDEQAGADRALLPPSGAPRRAALQAMALATGAAEKGVLQVYEQVFRPAPKRHEPWVERCRSQMNAGLAALERVAAARSSSPWLVAERCTQADITTACVFTFLGEALPEALATQPCPALQALTLRCEALPGFRATRIPFLRPGAPAAT